MADQDEIEMAAEIAASVVAQAADVEIQRLTAINAEMLNVLNAVRINMKNRDRREHEEKLYEAVCFVVGKAGEVGG